MNLSQSTVSDKTTKIKQILEEISKNPESELAIEYPNFAIKLKNGKIAKNEDFTPQLYNIWNFARNYRITDYSHIIKKHDGLDLEKEKTRQKLK